LRGRVWADTVPPVVFEEFQRRHRELVWSNDTAAPVVWLRAALLRPRFHTLLDAALTWGPDSVAKEWSSLKSEGSEETTRARPITERILRHIEEGRRRAAAGD